MEKYRKFLVAVIGAALVALDTFFGVSVAFGAEEVVRIVIPLLTAAGVWQAAND